MTYKGSYDKIANYLSHQYTYTKYDLIKKIILFYISFFHMRHKYKHYLNDIMLLLFIILNVATCIIWRSYHIYSFIMMSSMWQQVLHYPRLKGLLWFCLFCLFFSPYACWRVWRALLQYQFNFEFSLMSFDWEWGTLISCLFNGAHLLI